MMSKNQIIQIHSVNAEEFKDSIVSEIKSLLTNLHPPKKLVLPEYLTRDEVSDLLKVTPATLISWDKKGLIKPYRIGNLIRYKREEIDLSINEVYSQGHDRFH